MSTVQDSFKQVWETYTSAWRAETEAQKREIFSRSLAENVEYNDPLVATKGWDELLNYMIEFHKQIPGGHFVSNSFLCHHDQSITTWNMCDGSGAVVGEGISYGQYNDTGKLVRMTGFFETP